MTKQLYLVQTFPGSRELELTKQAAAQITGRKAEKDSHAHKVTAALHWILEKRGPGENRDLDVSTWIFCQVGPNHSGDPRYFLSVEKDSPPCLIHGH